MPDDVSTTGAAPAAASDPGAAGLLAAQPEPQDGAAGAQENQPPGQADAAPAPKDGDGQAPKDGTKPPEGAPEAYGDFELPDGFQMDKGALENFQGVAKELNLPQAQAQKLIDLYVAQVPEIARQAVATARAEQARSWYEKAAADPEYGGAALKDNVAAAARAIDRFGAPGKGADGKDVPGGALRQALEETGAANHPEVVRFFVRLGKAMGEDGLVRPGNHRPAQSTAKMFYPGFNPKE